MSDTFLAYHEGNTSMDKYCTLLLSVVFVTMHLEGPQALRAQEAERTLISAASVPIFVDGSVSGDTGTWPQPNFALRFDGVNDLVTFGTVATLVAHTIEAWVKPGVQSSPTGGYGLVAGHMAGPSQACNRGMGLNFDLDNLPSYLLDNAGCGFEGFNLSGPTPIVDTWTHLAGTYDGSTIRLYVNGVLVDEETGVWIDDSDWMTAGAVTFFNGQQAFYKGAVDELRVWDFARTEEQIRSTRFVPLGGTEPGLVGYWRMDEGAGQDVGDSSFAGITGVLGTNSGVEAKDPTWVVSGVPTFADGFESGDTSVWSGAVP